jgi:predicted dehydrogenase
VRVAVLGQGSIGRRHAGLLLELDCEVAAFDPARPGEAAVAGVESAASEEAALDGADAALVASPTSEHLRQARLALDAGCHVLVEKPLATEADAGVEDLVAGAEAAGLVLAVAMNVRFHPGPAAVAAHVRAGRLGRPLLGHFEFGSYLPDWRPGTDYRASYSAQRALGGGVLLDVVHELDLGAWMLGPAVDVQADLPHMSDLEIDVEDAVLAVVRHEAGARSTYALDYLDRSYRRRCRVAGSEATAEWDWRSGRVVVSRGDEELDAATVPRDFADTYRAELRAWLDAIGAGAIPDGSSLASGREGAALLRLVAAARRSAQTGAREAA